MKFRGWRRQAAACSVALALLAPPGAARGSEAGPYAPDNIEHTYRRLGWLCLISAFCPINSEAREIAGRAIGDDPSAQYRLGLMLLTGDGLPGDRPAGLAWVAQAAELGEPGAARDIADRLRNGGAIKVDETKIAAALKLRADKGDAEAMRALGPMVIRGRGVERSLDEGLALMTRATQRGSSGAEVDLSQLYLLGAPGLPVDRGAARMWLAAAAGHDNVDAMTRLGFMAMNASAGAPPGGRNVAEGFCWLARAALLDEPRAQEELSMILARGERDDRGGAIPIDLVQADLWFRLAARSPYHDNSQIRAMIEPQMTTAQLEEATRLFAAWRPRTPQDLRTLAIPLPGAGPTPRLCPAAT